MTVDDLDDAFWLEASDAYDGWRRSVPLQRRGQRGPRATAGMAFVAGAKWALERAAATPDGPRYAGPICPYCGCSPGEDCDVHDCLAHPSAVCRECDGAVDEECWRFDDGVKCEIGIHDPRCNDYHPFAPTGEPEQVPDLGWEVSLAEKSVLARAAGYAAASIEGLEQGDAAFRLLETALDIYGRAVRAESEARLAEARIERDHWKANHDNQVAVKRRTGERLGEALARASAAKEQVRVLIEALDAFFKALAEDSECPMCYPTPTSDHDTDCPIGALRASISTEVQEEAR